jgi:hypothetical protein
MSHKAAQILPSLSFHQTQVEDSKVSGRVTFTPEWPEMGHLPSDTDPPCIILLWSWIAGTALSEPIQSVGWEQLSSDLVL